MSFEVKEVCVARLARPRQPPGVLPNRLLYFGRANGGGEEFFWFLSGGEAMLVLTRRLGEEIRVGDDIRIKVASIRGSRVRIAIEAPKGLSIQRQEIREEETDE